MVREVETPQLAAARQTGACVVDVREPAGYSGGHVPARVGELPAREPSYVICASGNRGRTAAAGLTATGPDACSVRGGTPALAASGGPTVFGPHTGAA